MRKHSYLRRLWCSMYIGKCAALALALAGFQLCGAFLNSNFNKRKKKRRRKKKERKGEKKKKKRDNYVIVLYVDFILSFYVLLPNLFRPPPVTLLLFRFLLTPCLAFSFNRSFSFQTKVTHSSPDSLFLRVSVQCCFILPFPTQCWPQDMQVHC